MPVPTSRMSPCACCLWEGHVNLHFAFTPSSGVAIQPLRSALPHHRAIKLCRVGRRLRRPHGERPGCSSVHVQLTRSPPRWVTEGATSPTYRGPAAPHRREQQQLYTVSEPVKTQTLTCVRHHIGTILEHTTSPFHPSINVDMRTMKTITFMRRHHDQLHVGRVIVGIFN